MPSFIMVAVVKRMPPLDGSKNSGISGRVRFCAGFSVVREVR
ncbi:MAG: hypothetical protein U9Q37_08425 [Euryarchaeota archaeon]|nr:hypothetical protein [Euryarchaeota archaeon]